MRLGIPELLTIAVIALLVFGPKELPNLSAMIHADYREADNQSYSLSLILAFTLFLIVAFICVLTTLDH